MTTENEQISGQSGRSEAEQQQPVVMPYFAKCSLDSIVYMRGETVTNKPVNLALCKSIRKGKFAWYPDNCGRPSILFDGCGVEWAYNSESERDADFDRISGNRA
ncbi:hypothetical protein [Zhongshania sp.]|uniref:hypothetical protein n=1 Tax=Zhongshania sp. TaxID=1971902 RepID=UPI00356B398C